MTSRRQAERINNKEGQKSMKLKIESPLTVCKSQRRLKLDEITLTMMGQCFYVKLWGTWTVLYRYLRWTNLHLIWKLRCSWQLWKGKILTWPFHINLGLTMSTRSRVCSSDKECPEIIFSQSLLLGHNVCLSSWHNLYYKLYIMAEGCDF